MNRFETVLRSSDWSKLETSGGPATGSKLPDALRALVEASAPDEALRAYWGLDNNVVIQGQLFESALAILPALLAAIEESKPGCARGHMLDLLFEVVAGEIHYRAVVQIPDLGRSCRLMGKRHVSVIYPMINDSDPATRATAVDLLDILDSDRERFLSVVDRLQKADSSEAVQRSCEWVKSSSMYIAD